MKKVKDIILKYKIYIIFTGIIILSIISILLQSLERKSGLDGSSGVIDDQNSGKIAVYITGEIKNPGVYYISKNSRLNNILDIAGGLTELADIDKLNLAQKLLDSDKIIIAKKTENHNEENTSFEEESSDKININKADLSELTKLSGIGETTASKIIQYRKNNTFNQIEDIMNVPGIGENKFNMIKDDICTN
jgi:competence protein ComEA